MLFRCLLTTALALVSSQATAHDGPDPILQARFTPDSIRVDGDATRFTPRLGRPGMLVGDAVSSDDGDMLRLSPAENGDGGIVFAQLRNGPRLFQLKP